ncbi:chemotaxis protein CheC [Enterococcus sp. LJL98]
MNFTALEIDGLKEVINIGGGNAATSISRLVNRRIDMRVPEVEILSYEAMYEQVMEDSEEVYAVISQILGDVRGVFLFVLSDETAKRMTEFMIGAKNASDEVTHSAVMEMTNIVSNSFLNAIGTLLEQQLISSLPVMQYDYFGAVISSTYMALEQYDEQVLIIRNEFFYDEERLDASLFFIPEMGVTKKILTALGI